MSSSPREIGTLIVVVLKANHLPNKRHIGKQDPYCLAVVNGEKKRTKAIKRGGQHPEWDEELRFTLFEDDDGLMAQTTPGTPPPLPPKDARGPKKIQGGNIMQVACYADDPREPDLIGETDVDLTEVLTKGETDEWFTLSNKDKFAGKVYLELTFWSNAPPPEKKVTPKPPKVNKQYAGPGSFVPSSESPSRIGSSGSYMHSRPSSDSIPASIPSSLRASSSLAKLDLYVPPYEKSAANMVDQVASEFGDLSVSQHKRRESFPPVQYGYTSPSPNLYLGDGAYPCDPTHYAYDAHPQYQYDSNQPPPPVHNSRLPNIPVSSSGFVPLKNPSTYSPPTHVSDLMGYPPSSSHTPTPTYNSAIYQPPTKYPHPTQSPLPLPPNAPYLQSTTSLSYPSQSFPTAQSYTSFTTPTPAPPQQYTPSLTPPQSQPQNGPSSYPPYQTASSPSHESMPASNSASGAIGVSRPLPPQPHIVYNPPLAIASQEATSVPPLPPIVPPPPPPPPPLQFSQIQPPPPPPPPATQSTGGGSTPALTLAPPPPPPPPPLLPPVPSQVPPRRRASLPVPPLNYTPQQIPYQPPPPPPLPLPVVPIEGYSPAPIQPPPPLPTEPHTFSPSLPPNPPAQLEANNHWHPNGTVQGHSSAYYVPNHA
ncbi:Ingression protein fic1 [Leucoagaricus sp. SymC.cos]|nr:Ingression protein fic1 [Leucoagaricus sp. SymC.cos]